MDTCSVFVPRRIILWRVHETPTLLRSPIDDLYNIDQLLLIIDGKIQLVVVARAEIAHHMLIPPKEHDGTFVVEFVHLIEVWHLLVVTDVDDGEVAHPVSDLVQQFVLGHDFAVIGFAEANDHQALVLGHAGLVYVPSTGEVMDHGRHDGQKAGVQVKAADYELYRLIWYSALCLNIYIVGWSPSGTSVVPVDA